MNLWAETFQLFVTTFLFVGLALLYGDLPISSGPDPTRSENCVRVDISHLASTCPLNGSHSAPPFMISELITATYVGKLPHDSKLAASLLQLASNAHRTGAELQQILTSLHDVADRLNAMLMVQERLPIAKSTAVINTFLQDFGQSLRPVTLRSIIARGDLTYLDSTVSDMHKSFLSDISEMLDTPVKARCVVTASQLAAMQRLSCFFFWMKSTIAESWRIVDFVQRSLEDERAAALTGLLSELVKPNLDAHLASQLKELAVDLTRSGGLKSCSDVLSSL